MSTTSSNLTPSSHGSLHGSSQGSTDESTNGATLPAAERRPLTLLFCDIVDSTRLADRLAPEDLQSILDVFQDVCSAELDQYGGYVADRPGDGVLAYFGFPRALEDDAERSLHCSMAIMQSMLHARNKPGIPISIRIGIASGRVIMANMRREQHGRRPVAVGRYVHLASRMQSLAKAGEICVDDNTRRLVANAVQFEDRGEHTLRGFSKPERVWQPYQDSLQTMRFVPQKGISLSPLVGRERELSTLLTAFEDINAGHGRTLVALGDAGVGKSRLLHEFEQQIEARDKFVFRYQCSAHFSNTAFYPVVNFFERSAGIAAFDSLQDRRAKMQEYISIGVPEDRRLYSLLCHRLGLYSQNEDSQSDGDVKDGTKTNNGLVSFDDEILQWTARRRLEELTRAMVDRTLALAEIKPVVIILEDTHWIDPTSLAAMSELMHRTDHTRVMLLVTQRAPISTIWLQGDKAQIIELAQLKANELETLIQAAAGGRHIPRQVVSQILKSTDGVPLFVEEITREVLQSPNLHAEGDRYVLRGALPELVVPDNLEKSLIARLDRAGDAKQTAQVAAVLGRDFSEELLMDVTDEAARPDVERHVDKLVDVGILVNLTDRAGHYFGFRHALLQDAAYASIPRERKEELHRNVARVLESRWPQLVDRRPELLAAHLSAADNAAAAVLWWQRAAQQARRNYANEEAISWLTRGISELDRIDTDDDTQHLELDMQLELGDTLRLARGTSAPETREAYVAARAVCDTMGEVLPLSRALYGEFVTSFNNAALSTAGQVSLELLTLGRDTDHLESTVCGHQAVGMHAFVTGDFLAAKTHLEEALAHADEGGLNAIDNQYPGNSQSYLCWTLYILGEDDLAVDVLERSLQAARAHSPFRYALVLGNACYFYQFNQDAQKVLATTEELMAVSEEHGLGAWGDVARFFNSWAVFQIDSTPALLEQFSKVISLWSEEEIEIPYFKSLIAEACLRLKDYDSARKIIDEAIKLAHTTNESWYLPEIYRLQWYLSGTANGWDNAETHQFFDQAIAIGRRQDAKAWLRRLIESSMLQGYTPQADV